MKSVKLGALFLISIMALAGASAGYALWYDELYINGTVGTGSIGAEFVEAYGEDSEPDNKDVSRIECVVSDDGKTLTVTVYNAYPCIDYYNHFYVHNSGTIPIHVGNFVITSSDLPTDTTLEVCWDDLPDDYIQIHPCEKEPGYVHIHLDNDAAQGATYTFTATLTYWQWNEAAP